MTVSDGGTGDADGTADGRIVDPVGLASPAGAPAEPSAGGCSVGGTGGGPSGLAWSFGLLALFAGGLAARRLAGRAGRR